MRKLCTLLVVAGLVALVSWPEPAAATDFPVFVDGGSLVTSLDGGTTPVTVDLGMTTDWGLVLRCEGAQSTRYALCSSVPCACSSANLLVASDTTFDIPVTQSRGNTYRYMSLCTDDGGTPACKVYCSTCHP